MAGLREASVALIGRAVRRPSRVSAGNARIALAKQSSALGLIAIRPLLANGVEELDVEMAFLYRSIFRRRC
jgi:hypothetical protein